LLDGGLGFPFAVFSGVWIDGEEDSIVGRAANSAFAARLVGSSSKTAWRSCLARSILSRAFLAVALRYSAFVLPAGRRFKLFVASLSASVYLEQTVSLDKLWQDDFGKELTFGV
jgi:hypothetical protein